MQLFLNGTTQRIVEVAEDATVQTLQNIIAINDGSRIIAACDAVLLNITVCSISLLSIVKLMLMMRRG